MAASFVCRINPIYRKGENEMKLKALVLFAVLVLALLAVTPAFANRGDGALGVIYVTSQDLYYDTFVSADTLPMKGPFQKLVNGTTEFGPGNPGYLGGRWWVDVNGNDIMDEGDRFLLCMLLGPGRETP
jgi:hypothetical protein